MKQQNSLTNGTKKRTLGYNSWRGMLQRCLDSKHSSFKYYGGRGITVCERWRSFENFLADLGPCPSPRHTLERPAGGNYEVGNVVWGTWEQQVASRADPDRVALSQAGKRSAAATENPEARGD